MDNVEWNKIYKLSKKYFEYHNNLEVPYYFKTINGYEYDENGYNLGTWIINQRKWYKKIEDKNKNIDQILKIDLLNNINMIWNCKEYNFEKMYSLLKKYMNYHKNYKIPKNFKTINGYEYDEKGLNLKRWVDTERNLYKNNCMPYDKIQKFKQINFPLEVHKNEWDIMYELAKIYYKKFNNLKIPDNFKTINGYEYDENGVALGKWISYQRKKYKGREEKNLDYDKIKKLEEIKCIWFSKKVDYNLRNKEINEKNYVEKKKEILNRFRSLIFCLKINEINSKEDILNINQEFIKWLQ